MIRKSILWWLQWKYGICRIHLTLMCRGGGYEPRWICYQCRQENEVKNQHRGLYQELERERMRKYAIKLDAGRSGNS